MTKHFKTKEELDQMSLEEIYEKIRCKILSNPDIHQTEGLLYLKELEYYTELRFNEFNKRMDRWEEQVKNPGEMDKLDLEALQLILRCKEGLRKQLDEEMEKYEFKFILGLK